MRLTKLALLALVTSYLSLATLPAQNVSIIDPRPITLSTGSHALPVILYSPAGVYVDASAGGGVGGGAVTIADGADVTQGAIADAAVAAGAAGTVNAKLRRLTTDLATVATNTGAATAAGGNIIGKVGIDQTTPGTTNLVQLPANQSVNEAQVNGVTPLMGNGVTGTGSQRVTIASDNTAFSVNAAGTKTNNNAAPGATNVGALGYIANAAAPSFTEGNLVLGSMDLTGNARTNVSLINGVAPLMGIGNTGTGSPRVTIASDSPPVVQPTGAVPTRAFYIAGQLVTANPTNGTNGNAVALTLDHAGRVIVTPSAIRELVASQQTNIATTSETTFITAAGASVFADLTDLIITTAGSAAATITVKDVTAGTTRMVLNYPNAAVAPGQPLVLHFSPPIPQATANSAWTITNSVATAINVTAVYVKNL